MGTGEILFGMSLAREMGKKHHQITLWTFDEMKKAGSTHYCCYCGLGFRPAQDGSTRITNTTSPVRATWHDEATHADGVIPDVEKFSSVKDWIRSGPSVSDDFKFLIAYK